jgi:hypothetical protein
MQKKLLNNIDRPIGLNWTFQAGMHVPAFLICISRDFRLIRVGLASMASGAYLIFLMKFILNMV